MLIAGVGYRDASAVLDEIEIQMGIHDAELESDFGITLDLWPESIRKRYPISSFTNYGLTMPTPSKEAPTGTKIEPETGLYPYYGVGATYVSDVRGEDAISFSDIDRLMKLGPYVFASRIKKGPIMSALSGKRKWKVDCDDAKLKTVVEADLERIFLRYTTDILTSLDYGAAFGSVMWEKKTASDIGAGKGVGRSTNWFVVDKIQWAHPDSIKRILRNEKTMEFAGYTHRRKVMKPHTVVVDPMQALLITYNGSFGNMWGQPMGEVIYDFAFWYEVVMRAFLRYLQRMGTPVCIVYGPNRGTSKRPDGTRISNPEYGLLLAGAAAMSSGIYIPNEFDLQTGQPMWRIEYLSTDQRGDQFSAALTYLSTQITRGVVIGDRAATQDDVGGYNIGAIHDKLTQVDNDMIFKSIIGQFNPYLVRRYGQFNVDYNNPPRCIVVAEVIDPMEQDVLMKLFATAGNVKRFEGSPLDVIDWEEAFRSIHAPVLTDEEFEEQYKETQERKKEAQEQSMETAQKFSQQQPGGNGAQPKPQGQPDKQQQTRLSIYEHLADGGVMPILVTPEQVREFFLPEQESIYLDEIDEMIVQLGVLEWLKDKAADTAEFISRKTTGKISEAARKAGKTLRKDGKPVQAPDFESKHPRGEAGKFATKEEEGEEEEEGGVEEIGEELVASIKQALALADPEEYGKFLTDRAVADGRITQAQADQINAMSADLSADNWRDSDDGKGIKGQWNVGDTRFDALGDMKSHNMIGAVVTATTTKNRLESMGYDLNVDKFGVLDKRSSGALAKYIDNEVGNLGPISIGFAQSGEEWAKDMREQDGWMATAMREKRLAGDRPGIVVMSDGLIDNFGFKHYETIAAHEMIHSQQRLNNKWIQTKDDAYYEEAFTVVLQQEYNEKYGIPANLSGYENNVKEIAGYAQDMGWSKAKFYQFAAAIHQNNGDQYGPLMAQMRDAATASAPSAVSTKWLDEWLAESEISVRDMWDTYYDISSQTERSPEPEHGTLITE